MNTTKFLEILQDPSLLQNEEIFDLEDIIQKYPYFQAARVLYLKGLKNQNSFRYNQSLKTTAIYTPDRSVLFHFITSDAFHSVVSNKEEKEIIHDIEVRDEIIIDKIHQHDEKDPKLAHEYKQEEEKSLSFDDLNAYLEDLKKNKANESSDYIEVETLKTDESFLKENKLENLDDKDENDTNKTDELSDFYEENTNDLTDDTRIDTFDIENTTSNINTTNALEKHSISNYDIDESIKNILSHKAFEIQREEEIEEENIREEKEIEEKESDLLSFDIPDKNSLSFEIDKQRTIVNLESSEESFLETTAIHTASQELYFEIAKEEKEVVDTVEIKEENTVNSDEFPEESIEVKIDVDIDSPIHFNKNDTYSFGQWMQLSSFKPIDRSIDTIPSDKKLKKMALIDEFMTKNHKIIPNKEAGFSVDFNKVKKVETEGVMTETLAKVYIEQNKFENAIKAYEILSLKFPEKSSFFADQIKMVKDLKKNKSS